MNELEYILNKYEIDPAAKLPHWIDATRIDLARLFHELDYRVGVEVGVWCGKYLAVLCEENPQAQIVGVDPWEQYPGYWKHISQDRFGRKYQETQARLAQFNNWELRREYSRDEVQDFLDGSLDFVYIDANHDFLHIAQDLCWWSKKVRPGGIVSGHDFMRKRGRYQCDVKDVVQAFTYAHGIRPWFVINDSGKSPSWFYVVKG